MARIRLQDLNEDVMNELKKYNNEKPNNNESILKLENAINGIKSNISNLESNINSISQSSSSGSSSADYSEINKLKLEINKKINKTEMNKNNLENILDLKQLAFKSSMSWDEITQKPNIPQKISDLQNSDSFIKTNELINDINEKNKNKVPSCYALNDVYTKLKMQTNNSFKTSKGYFKDITTMMEKCSTYTKTIPLGFNAKNGRIITMSQINDMKHLSIIYITTEANKAYSICLDIDKDVFYRAIDSELCPYSSNFAGINIGIKDCYIEGSNMIILFNNGEYNNNHLDITMNWEVWE